MFTYYYRIWRRVLGGGYDGFVDLGAFRADSLQEAHSRAHQLVQPYGKEYGDLCIEFATAKDRHAPCVVYFPPF